MPSLHCAIAPAGLWSSTEAGAAAVFRGAGARLAAGAGAELDPVIAFFIRWNMLGWAGAGAGLAAGAGLDTLVATVVELLLELLHWTLLALPALVQS